MDFTIQTIDHLKPLVQGFRKRANLTQAAMAEKLGITQQSYAQIESNLASTSVERLFTILRLLDVTIQLTDGDPDTVPDVRIKARTRNSSRRQQVTSIDKPSEAGADSHKQPSAPSRKAPGKNNSPSRINPPAPAKVVKPDDTTKW